MENISVHELQKLVFINSDGLKELCLQGKQLSRVPDAVMKMTDVEVLNLSDNNYLTGLPVDVCHLVKLKTLLLENNNFKELPNVVFQLTHLTTLNMSYNQLTAISHNITKLQQLQVLDLSHNSLGELPDDICQLTNLTSLNMSDNQLTTISHNITKLQQLQVLDLSYNSLVELTDDICQLKNLTTLNMSDNQLTTISHNITKLQQLQVLDLSHNKLRKLPEVICQLTNLTTLNMSHNQLTTISHNITKLQQLQVLDLSSNRLVELPDVICQLTNLTTLNMSYTQLTSISHNITKLQQLRVLDLSWNKLVELPDDICQLTNLTTLNMSHNYLTTISHNITKLQQLQVLDLSSNILVELTDDICQLTNLTTLNMSHNQLTTISHNITKLQQLQVLDLSYNSLVELTDDICQLKNLTTLNMSYTQLTTISHNITKLQQLRVLDLSFNELVELPDDICQLTNLTTLNMSDNDLTTISHNITKLQQLQVLDLSSSLIELPDDICQLTNLTTLNMSHNFLTTISHNITKLQQLQVLDLSSNSLVELTDDICQLTNLTTLNMSHNRLTTISHNITKLQQLQVLDLSYNSLVELTDDICQLKNLTTLNMSYTQLTTISHNITKLQQLRVLDLSFNELVELPDDICQLTNLTTLNMSDNQLTTISHNITKLQQLQVLDLSRNRLGELPDDICQLTNLTSLAMSRNQLTAISHNITKLQQLQVLDLSWNILVELPDDICQLTNLTTLNMSYTQLTTISHNITKLQQLQVLDLRVNGLEELPDDICQLTNLTTLNMSHNLLTTIPHNITKLQQLQVLDLNYNCLVELTDDICQLKNLTTLNMYYTDLTTIPHNITKLQQLRVLDLSFNGLVEIPEAICRLKSLVIFQVTENPLKGPPVAICNQGLPAIRTYFQDVRRGKTRHHKLVLLGSSGAGKSSLAKTLVDNKPSCVRQEDRTIVLDRIAWETRTNEEIMSISIVDFGGHEWYKIVHHLFLDEGALLLLVVNLARYSEEIFHKDVRSWLDVIASRVPTAPVLLVGTHADCFKNEKELCSRRSEVLEDVSCLVKDGNGESVNVVSETMITVSSKAFTGIEDLRDIILNFVSKNGQVIPSSWWDIYNYLQSSDMIRDQPFLTFNAVRDVVEKKSKDQDLEVEERRTETVLTFFHSIGALLWFEHSSEVKKFVFQRADFLTELMKAVFSERLSAESLSYRGFFKNLFTSDSFEEAKKDLLIRGIMSHDLLTCLWKHLNLHGELFNAMMELFVLLDLCFSMDESVADSRLRFPWFLTDDAPKTTAVQTMLHDRPAGGSYRLSLKNVYPARCPPPLYHIFVVRIHRHVQDIKSRHDWKDGMYASVEETQVLVHRSDKSTEKVISVSVEGSDLVEVWKVLLSCHGELKSVMRDWAGIRCDCWILCPHCTRLGIEKPGRFDAKNLETKCPRGKVTCDRHDERIAACLVYPVGSDFSIHQKGLEEFKKHWNQDAVSLPNSQDSEKIKTGSPSLNECHHLAGEVLSSWKALGRELGITDADLNQIKADNQGPYEQCYNMLRKWIRVQASPATYEDLARALQSKPVDRGDLAAKYCSVSGAQKSREVCSRVVDWQYTVKDGVPTEDEVSCLAKGVQEEGNWKQLGRELKLEESDLFEIDHNPIKSLYEKIRAMLSKWKQINGPDATYRELAEGLERVGRRDLIREFCRHENRKRPLETEPGVMFTGGKKRA